MRRFWLIAASLFFFCNVAAAQTPDTQTLVVELRLGARSVDTMAWRDAQGEISVDRPTIDALGLRAPEGAGDRVALHDVAGLSYSLDEANAAIVLSCTAACYRGHEIGAAEPVRPSLNRSRAGGFMNVDLTAAAADHEAALAGAFELGLFGRHGAGGTTWIADSDTGNVVRLDTQWTFDRPAQRLRLRLGDSFTRGGATGVPVRFGGIQLATDFTLDPGFIPFPTPTLHGEAAAPSTVDLYVDGALRMRQSVDAGPFSIVDAPVLSGAGVAQVVVTDALGRQQVFAQNFYASPMMLRAGLADYSVALGAERLNYTSVSDDYGRSFASGVYRYGFANWITGEARVEAANGASNVGVGGSIALNDVGQIDFAYAHSTGDGEGGMARVGWYRQGRALSFSVDAQGASRRFTRLGDDREAAPMRLQTSATVGVHFERFGSASLAFVSRDSRDSSDVRTIALSYTPTETRFGHFDISAIYVDEDNAEPFLTFGIGFSRTLHRGVSAGARVETRRGRVTTNLNAQRAPDMEGGFGWYARGGIGDLNRIDAGVQHIGERDESSLEISHTDTGDGARVQFATGVAWIGKTIEASRPVRDAFAFVDVGAPHVRVLRDRRRAGTTDKNGRVLLVGLRAYEANRIGVELDDLPFDSQLTADEIEVTPAARSGVVARFQITHGEAGETHIADAFGAPLPAGAFLTRQNDGVRFPVADGGRVYISGLSAPAVFTSGSSCALTISPADLDSHRQLQCGSAS